MMRRPRSTTLFPYTTLFGSVGDCGRYSRWLRGPAARPEPARDYNLHALPGMGGLGFLDIHRRDRRREWLARRSEEHTSELQSRQYLVCRLLLETIQDA